VVVLSTHWLFERHHLIKKVIYQHPLSFNHFQILDFLYQEAFLTTYRTFITPSELIDKLIERYTFFSQFEAKKKLARYAFSLLIRVIDEIEYEIFRIFIRLFFSSSNELSENLMKKLSNFVATLIRHGELQLSKLLRRKSLERFNKSQINHEQSPQDIVLIQNSISSKRAILLDFHSVDISEQLTLMDSELFLKIQLSEILYMSMEKGEDYSPNLAAFTEHFNNISYW
jgi:Rap guanine nucleotide exchange factor 1